MPKNIKIGLSIVILVVGAVVYAWEVGQGNKSLSVIVAGLAVFMVLAMWIFPETNRINKDVKK